MGESRERTFEARGKRHPLRRHPCRTSVAGQTRCSSLPRLTLQSANYTITAGTVHPDTYSLESGAGIFADFQISNNSSRGEIDDRWR
jgi:hypothetical protein